jgi:MerR family transcriptional regulator, light-induced transcriptional regulator
VTTQTPTGDLTADYLAALLAGDSIRARHLIDRAVDGGMPVADVYLQVLQPALEEIGKRWESDEIGIAYEHQATAITQGILGALGPRLRVAPTSGRLAVLACTPGEMHSLGVQMLGDFLEAEGWEVLLLGASVPAPALAKLVDDESPDAVALSTSSPAMLPGVADTLAALSVLDPKPFIAVGGLAWRSQPEGRALELGADCCLTGPYELARELARRFPPLTDDDELE